MAYIYKIYQIREVLKLINIEHTECNCIQIQHLLLVFTLLVLQDTNNLKKKKNIKSLKPRPGGNSRVLFNGNNFEEGIS